jgi:hypothetical protein
MKIINYFLVTQFGGFLNVVGARSAIHTALNKRNIDAKSVDPWSFPTPELYKEYLERNGFEVPSIGKRELKPL